MLCGHALTLFAMQGKTLSVFIDESGRFQFPDEGSRYYILSLVLHDQNERLDVQAANLDGAFSRLGLSNVCFHAGPLIRQNGPFSFFDWTFRRKIFNYMLAFARKIDFRYHCLVVDKRLVDSKEQIVAKLASGMAHFLDVVVAGFPGFSLVKVYYDCGQTPVTNLLHDTFRSRAGQQIAFAQAVRPEKYKLFQLADMICTLKLVELKLQNGDALTESESKFFGGPRKFKRDFLKPVKRMEI